MRENAVKKTQIDLRQKQINWDLNEFFNNFYAVTMKFHSYFSFSFKISFNRHIQRNILIWIDLWTQCQFDPLIPCFQSHYPCHTCIYHCIFMCEVYIACFDGFMCKFAVTRYILYIYMYISFAQVCNISYISYICKTYKLLPVWH